MTDRIALKKGTVLKHDKFEYTIKEELGRGASCIAYSAKSHNDVDVVIKELFPRVHGIMRADKGNSLMVSEAVESFYEEAKIRFDRSLEMQNLLMEQKNTKNSTFASIDSFKDNNTIYSVTVANAGSTLQENTIKDITEFLKIAKTVSTLIGKYHNKNFLHMDIKPGNIFIIDETYELVKLFDFDTVVKIDDIQNGGFYSYTEDFAAPEVKSDRYWEIGPKSDLYSIGATLFYCIFQRAPDRFDTHPCASYDFEAEVCNDLFIRKNPALKQTLKEIFRKTLCCIPGNRFNNTDELIEALDKAINKCNSVYLKNDELRTISPHYIPREDLTNKIKEEFGRNNNIVFLCGLGGIGKTEAAREYARENQRGYQHIQLAPYCGSLKCTLARLEFIGIEDKAGDFSELNINKLYSRNMNLLSETKDDEPTLIVVDNYDPPKENKEGKTPDKDVLKALTKIKNVDFLFTTHAKAGDYCLDVQPMDKGILTGLFVKLYAEDNAEIRKQAERLIELTCGHTLTIELVAKMAKVKKKRGGKKLSAIIDELEENPEFTQSKLFDTPVGEGFSQAKVNQMIADVFNMIELSEDEKNIMRHATLLPFEGIEGELFAELLGIDNYDKFLDLSSNLFNLNWLRMREKNISVHPVVSGVAIAKLKPTLDNCADFIKRFIEFTQNNQFVDLDQKLNISFLRKYYAIKKRMDVLLLGEGRFRPDVWDDIQDLLLFIFKWRIVDYQELLDRDYCSDEHKIIDYLSGLFAYEAGNSQMRKVQRKTELAKELRTIIPTFFRNYRIKDWDKIESFLHTFQKECLSNMKHLSALREFAVLSMESIGKYYPRREPKQIHYAYFGSVLYLMVFIAEILRLSDGFKKMDALKKKIHQLQVISVSNKPSMIKKIYNDIYDIFDIIQGHINAEDYFDISFGLFNAGRNIPRAFEMLCEACSWTGRDQNDEKIKTAYSLLESCANMKSEDLEVIVARYEEFPEIYLGGDSIVNKKVKRIIRKKKYFKLFHLVHFFHRSL